jgi:hypothetical protein
MNFWEQLIKRTLIFWNFGGAPRRPYPKKDINIPRESHFWYDFGALR